MQFSGGDQLADEQIKPAAPLAELPPGDRFERERRGLVRAFVFHPFVAITVPPGNPPTKYRVDLRVRSLMLNAEGLQFADAVALEVTLPPGFPTVAPTVRPLVAVFHPNFSQESAHFSEWRAGETVVDLIRRVGEFLAWRAYDPATVVNPSALQWMQLNAATLPLDPSANFAPDAGGEPLLRLEHFGPAALAQARQSLEQAIASINLENTTLKAGEVAERCRQLRATLFNFLEPDAPAPMRTAAAELDRTAAAMPALLMTWERALRLKNSAAGVLQAATHLSAIGAPLTAAIDALHAMVQAPLEGAADAARLIPDLQALQPLEAQLSALISEATTRAGTLSSTVGAMSSLPPFSSRAPGEPLGAQCEALSSPALDQSQRARKSAADAAAATGAPLARARDEATALRGILMWREYIDLMGKAAELENRLKRLGADGIGAWFISSAAGAYGPFQLEQPVELGAVTVVVRGDGTELEVLDASRELSLGRSANGRLTLTFPAGSGEDRPIMKFSLMDGCTETVSALESLREQTLALIDKLQTVTPLGDSWCGRMLGLFGGNLAQQAARAEHRKAMHRWQRLSEDLQQLVDFKARLQTHHLLSHAQTAIPALIGSHRAEGGKIDASRARMSAIAGKGARDVETGWLITSPKLAQESDALAAAMAAAKKEQQRLESAFKALATRIRERLGAPPLCGRPEVPQLRRLPGVSPGLAAFEDAMSDDSLRAAAARVADLLKAPMAVNIKPARPGEPAKPATHHAADLSLLDASAGPVRASEPVEQPAEAWTNYATDDFFGTSLADETEPADEAAHGGIDVSEE